MHPRRKLKGSEVRINLLLGKRFLASVTGHPEKKKLVITYSLPQSLLC